MNFLQTSQKIAIHSAELAERDPHGIIVTIVSVSVVLTSLLILFLAYLMIGRIVQKCEKKPVKTPSGKKMQARGIHNYDSRNNIITIRRAGSKEPLVLSRKTNEMSRGLLEAYGSELDVAQENIVSPEKGDGNEEQQSASSGTIKAPLPGTIISVSVNIGDKVETGQEVAVLEAMKMENSLESEYEGTVTAIHISAGATVLEGTEIITIG